MQTAELMSNFNGAKWESKVSRVAAVGAKAYIKGLLGLGGGKRPTKRPFLFNLR